jgi:hypothetical protein
MPLVPDAPFPKTQGDNIRSKDWNDTVNEVVRLDNAKANRAGAETLAGPLTVTGKVGIGGPPGDGTLEVTGARWDQHLVLSNTTNAGAGSGLYFRTSVRNWALIGTHGGAGSGPGKFGIYDATANAYRVVINEVGNVGIGVSAPTEDLHAQNRVRAGNFVMGPWPANGVYAMVGAASLDHGQAGNYALLQSSVSVGADRGYTFLNSPTRVHLRIQNADKLFVDPGALTATVPVVVAQAHTIRIGQPRAGIYGNDGIRGEPNLWLDAAASVIIKQGFLTRGMDVAERFPTAAGSKVEQGQVVVYDEHALGVRPCAQAYDATAVGIVSEAPACIIGLGSGDVPIAMCGRVPCWVDADIAPIAAGDLLVSSPTPGHAQKLVDSSRSGGRVIGKALQSLASGKAKILTFVLAA